MKDESPHELIPSRREMRGLLPHVRAGQPEVIRRWLRGAVFHHAVSKEVGIGKYDAIALALSETVARAQVRVEVA